MRYNAILFEAKDKLVITVQTRVSIISPPINSYSNIVSYIEYLFRYSNWEPTQEGEYLGVQRPVTCVMQMSC